MSDRQVMSTTRSCTLEHFYSYTIGVVWHGRWSWPQLHAVLPVMPLIGDASRASLVCGQRPRTLDISNGINR